MKQSLYFTEQITCLRRDCFVPCNDTLMLYSLFKATLTLSGGYLARSPLTRDLLMQIYYI
jgi:hypothetical protein